MHRPLVFSSRHRTAQFQDPTRPQNGDVDRRGGRRPANVNSAGRKELLIINAGQSAEAYRTHKELPAHHHSIARSVPFILKIDRAQGAGLRTETYCMTSSALRRSDCGTVRPTSFAVLRLTESSNLVGCSTGRSLGGTPLRILSTKTAARRQMSSMSAPYDISPPASTYSRSSYIDGSRPFVVSSVSCRAFGKRSPDADTRTLPACALVAVLRAPSTSLASRISSDSSFHPRFGAAASAARQSRMLD